MSNSDPNFNFDPNFDPNSNINSTSLINTNLNSNFDINLNTNLHSNLKSNFSTNLNTNTNPNPNSNSNSNPNLHSSSIANIHIPSQIRTQVSTPISSHAPMLKSNFSPHGLLRITPLLPQSLLISHPSTSPILLNVPSSLLRYTNQNRIKKIFSIDRVLLSGLELKSMSGFCGWMLTRMDVKRTQKKTEDWIEVYGPKGLFKEMESYGWIIKRDMLRMVVKEHSNESSWDVVLEDEVMNIRGILFYDKHAPVNLDRGVEVLPDNEYITNRHTESSFAIKGSTCGIRERRVNEGQFSEDNYPLQGAQLNQSNQSNQGSHGSQRSQGGYSGQGNRYGTCTHLNKEYHQKGDRIKLSQFVNTGISDQAEMEHGKCPSTKRRRIEVDQSKFPTWRVLKNDMSNCVYHENPTHVPKSSEDIHYYPTVMQFALHIKGTRGKFLPQEAKRLGLKPGPQFGELSKGNVVTLENGIQIHPDQVHTPSQKGVVVLIIYGTKQFHDIILNRQNEFKEYMMNGEHEASFVYHMVPQTTWKDREYQSFVDEFSSTCQHIVCNDDTLYRHDIFSGSALLQEKLSLIDSGIFKSTKETIYPTEPIPTDNSFNSSVASSNVDSVIWSENKIPAEHGLQVIVHPRDKIQVDKSFVSNNSLPIVTADEELQVLVQNYKQAVETSCWDTTNPHEEILKKMADDEAEITFLGTGSAVPSKYRNVTGIYLNLFNSGSMFMDCGEGTFTQLCRVYGRSNADTLLERLRIVHISHIHADHHLGLLEILERRAEISREKGLQLEPVVVIGPAPIYQFIRGIEQCAHPRNFNYVFIDSTDLMPHEGRYTSSQHFKNACDALGFEEFYNILVEHSCTAYGLIIKHQKGWKIVFSGDTRPCAELVKHGRNATLLIHEATHDDELQYEAVARKHSTTNEAISIAEEMNAYRTILTHFSQRYPKFPKLHENVEDHVGIAFDLCRVNFKCLKTFPKALPAMKKLFEETLLEDEGDDLPDIDHL